MDFVDEATIHVRGGRGGDGCLAFRREKYVPRGGPAGGDGGDGGSVWLEADEGQNTLYHLRRRSLYAAENGRRGEGFDKTGASGDDLVIEVPLGTSVRRADSGEAVGELLEDGQRLMVARGGRGGRGNARFATATNQAPRRTEPGEEGEEHRLLLELKLLADVGLVGLPNAGKSTLLSVLSAARPKVAEYPFTTLVPHLGVVAGSPEERPLVIADLPGLIAGAAQGAGLGHRFLRHVERCRVLVHLVDLAALEGDLEEGVSTIEDELAAYRDELLRRPRLLVGSKADAARPDRRAALRRLAERRGLEQMEVSAVSGSGLEPLVGRLRELLRQAVSEESPTS